MARPGGATTLAATFVTLGLSYGVWYSYSVFLVALLHEFGWPRAVLAGAFSVFTLAHGVLSLPLGWLADRVSPRWMVLAGGAVLAAGLALDSLIVSPLGLYAAFGLATAAGVALAGWVPAVVLIQRWFPERIGTALGLTSAGIGVGIFAVVPACQWVIGALGWRAAFRVLAVTVAVWVVPATLLLVRDAPGAERPARARGSSRGVTLGEALRTSPFWLLAVSQMCGSAASQMLLTHQVAYLVDQGLTALAAASVVSVVGLASIVGKVGGGWLSDRVGRETTFTGGMAAVIAAIGALGLVALAPDGPWPWAYGVLVGAGYAVTAPLIPALVADRYYGRHFGAIFGTLQVFNAVGGSSGPWIAGLVFDATGSYAVALAGGTLAAAAAAAALWTARARARRLAAASFLPGDTRLSPERRSPADQPRRPGPPSAGDPRELM